MPATPASYPSDLSEAQWKLIAPLIPVPQSYGRPREYGLRETINAIFYVLRSGCSWRMQGNRMKLCFSPNELSSVAIRGRSEQPFGLDARLARGSSLPDQIEGHMLEGR